MNKISVIIKREYTTRVKKKSFIIMTLLTPVLMASMFIIPALVMSNKDRDFKKIAVVEDGTDLFRGAIPNFAEAEFVYLKDVKINDIKNTFESAGYYGVLYISSEVIETPNAVQLISRKQPPMSLLEHINSSLEKEVEKQKMLAYNIKDLDQILKSIHTNVSVQTIKIDETGKTKQTSTGASMVLAYFSGFLMYMLVFMFGAQVMRGVIEEKTSRVVEVIVSSVKPFQLMVGKIVGIALVGLTQFAVWVMLTGAIVTVAKVNFSTKNTATHIETTSQSLIQSNNVAQAGQTVQATPQENEFMKGLDKALDQNWALIIPVFIFYFLTGYLLYASLFAAVGSAVDSETDTQQFMLPITIPIILGLVVAMGTMENPESSISFWFSLIPLTSPIVMVARMPFDVPGWQIALSMLLMLATVWGAIWMAARIYRTGILMYGKKSSYGEIWKWLKYKE
jgi:ABC-2 type transport system permease protein